MQFMLRFNCDKKDFVTGDKEAANVLREIANRIDGDGERAGDILSDYSGYSVGLFMFVPNQRGK